MNNVNVPAETKRVSIIGSLVSGFEMTADKVILLLIPLFIDLFIWFGPRLDYNPVIGEAINQYDTMETILQTSADGETLTLMQDFRATLTEMSGEFPLLHLPLLGMPSLLSGGVSGNLPFNFLPRTFEIQSSQDLLLVYLLSGIAGLFFGSIYLALIGSAVAKGQIEIKKLISRLPVNFIQLALFCIVMGIAALFILSPFFLVSSLVSAMGGFLALVGLGLLTLGGVILLWLVVGLIFTPHGLYMNEKPIHQAMLDSLRIVQWSSFSSMMLVTLLFVLNWAFNHFIWPLSGTNNWLILAAIIGHAFLITGSITATFIYFKGQFALWEMRKDELIQRLQKQSS